MNDLYLIDRGCGNKQGVIGSKLDVYDWVSDVLHLNSQTNIVELRIKNWQKDYFKNVNKLKFAPCDIVTVEANSRHYIGIVPVAGELPAEQMKRTYCLTTHKNMTIITGNMEFHTSTKTQSFATDKLGFEASSNSNSLTRFDQPKNTRGNHLRRKIKPKPVNTIN